MKKKPPNFLLLDGLFFILGQRTTDNSQQTFSTKR